MRLLYAEFADFESWSPVVHLKELGHLLHQEHPQRPPTGARGHSTATGYSNAACRRCSELAASFA